MSLVDELESLNRSPGRRCGLSVWLASRTPQEAAVVRAAIANPDKSTRKVAEVLTANGYSCGQSTIQNHRRGVCVTCRS
jgi:hypothetical protein